MEKRIIDRKVRAMFLISNRCISSSQSKYGQWFIYSDTDIIKNDEQVCFLDGIEYNRFGHESNALFLTDDFSVKNYVAHMGDYFAFNANLETGDFVIFISPTGRKNVYKYYSDDCLIISDDLVLLLGSVSLNVGDLNNAAILDFYLFGYPMGESTFIKKIKRIPAGYIISYRYKEREVIQRKVIRYEFEFPSTNIKESDYEELDYLMRQSVRRILQIQGEGATYCLALSNGLDSRVTGYYFKDCFADVFSYFFGETCSNEYLCAKSVADRLRIPLYQSEGYDSFVQYIEPYARSRPFTDVEWCKYALAKEHLPSYDAIVSGALGNHLFGGWEFNYSNAKCSDESLAHEWIDKLAQISIPKSKLDSVCERIASIFKENDANVLSKKYELYIRSVIPYEKDCEFFTDNLGKPHYSLFYDWDIIQFSFRFPLRSYKFRSFFLEYLARKLPFLHPRFIHSTQVLNTHKPLEKWLSRNTVFSSILNSYWDTIEFVGYDLCHTELDLRLLREQIYNGVAKRKDIHFLFRFLTISCLMKNYLGVL